MSNANERTIETYNIAAQTYIDSTQQTVDGNQKKWIDLAFHDVDTAASILEIGSAFGRDARYLIEKGYAPTLTDGTQAFVTYLIEQGFHAELLDIVRQRPNEIYDAIYASAVFLHFTDEDFEAAVTHVREALNEDGKFIFSLKTGEGQSWSTEKMGSERYFRYWRRNTVEATLGNLGLVLIDDQTFSDEAWLYLTARTAR